MSKIYKLNIFTKILFVLSATVFLLINSIFTIGFFKPIYSHIYDRTDIGGNTGFSKEMYLKEIDNYRSYLISNNDDALLNPPRYNKDDLAHMVDVRKLFQLGKIISIFGLIIIIAIIIYAVKRNAICELIKSAKWILIIPIFVLPFLLMDFDALWIKFHEIFFTNDLWLMDPDVSLMINLLPGEIFNAISIATVVFYYLSSMILVLILKFLSRRKDEIK